MRRNDLSSRGLLLPLAVFLGLLAVSVRAPWAQTYTDVNELMRIAQEAQARLDQGKTQLYYQLLNSNDPVVQALNNDPLTQLELIDPLGVPVYFGAHNKDAATFVRTTEVHPGGVGGYNLSGAATTGQQLAIWDGGVPLTTHIEFEGRVTVMDGGATDAHPTKVAGTMIAGGVDSYLPPELQLQVRGMSYEAELAAWEWTDDTPEMAMAAAAGTFISNHSYGEKAGWTYAFGQPYWYWFGNLMIDASEDFKFGYYDDKAREWDEIAYYGPYYLIVTSAGNHQMEGLGVVAPGDTHQHWDGMWVTATDVHDYDGGAKNGFDTIATHNVAKNILTVGACSDFAGTYTGPGDVPLAAGSSMGPADDGRIKPDVVAPGLLLFTTDAVDDSSYLNVSGTSIASPVVAGSANLLREHYQVKYGKSPRSATLKALIIHTAEECGPADGPDYMFGWGLMNTRRAADIIDATDPTTGVGIGETILNNGETDYFYFRSDLVTDFRVTVAWTDPAGTPVPMALNDPTPMLVNDLDIRVDYLSGTPVTHMPWVLDPVDYEDPATRGDNTLDNVEQIFIDDAPPGLYRLAISHKGTLVDAPQAYSLIWSGMEPTQGAIDIVGSRFELFPGLLANPPPPFNVATTGGEDRGVFITAIEDIFVRDLGIRGWVPCPSDFFVAIYEADGNVPIGTLVEGAQQLSIGQPIAQGWTTSYHPGWNYHYIPVNAQLNACQDYYVSFQLPQNMLSWPWYNEGLLQRPIDVGGAIRMRDGAFEGDPANGAMPMVSFIAEVDGEADDVTSDLEVPNTPWITCSDTSIERGMFVRAEKTIRVQSLAFEAAVTGEARFAAKIYDASGLARGALIAEGGRTIDDSPLQMHEVPIAATLHEGHQYDVVMEFSPTTWSCVDDATVVPFTVDNSITVLDGELAGDPGSTKLPHMTVRWREGAGGVPFDLSKNADVVPPPFTLTSAIDNYGLYVKSLVRQEVYSLGWMADVPDGSDITIRIYEANGTSRGALLSEGTVTSAASGMRWHDVPVSASLEAGGEYDFDVGMDGVNAFGYWDDSSGVPYASYGVVEVVDGESWGDPGSDKLIYVRMNACDEVATPVPPNRPTIPPSFVLEAPYPNPVATTATIRFSLDDEGPVSMTVYDVRGRRVASLLSDQPRPAGWGTVQLDAGGLSPGVYFVRFESRSKAVAQKIIVIR